MGTHVESEGTELENTEEPKQKSSFRKGATTILSAAIGWAVAHYFGFSLLIIPFAGLMVIFILARVVKKPDAPFLNAVAFQFAHLAWFTAGVMFTKQYFGLLDVFVIAPFFLWLVARPKKAPAYILLVINLLSVVYNVVLLAGATPEIVKPLLLHLLIRTAIIASLIYGLRRFTPKTTLELEPNEATPIEPGHELHHRPNE